MEEKVTNVGVARVVMPNRKQVQSGPSNVEIVDYH